MNHKSRFDAGYRKLGAGTAEHSLCGLANLNNFAGPRAEELCPVVWYLMSQAIDRPGI